MSSQVDWGALTGLAATIGGGIAAWNSRRTKRVLGTPQANGNPAPTLTDLLVEIVELDTYSHVRNHDLITNDTVLYITVTEIARALNIAVPSREEILQMVAERLEHRKPGGQRWTDPPTPNASGQSHALSTPPPHPDSGPPMRSLDAPGPDGES